MFKNSKLLLKPSTLETQKTSCSLVIFNENKIQLSDSFAKLTKSKITADIKNLAEGNNNEETYFESGHDVDENKEIKEDKSNLDNNKEHKTFVFGENLNDRVENIKEEQDKSLNENNPESKDILASAKEYSEQIKDSRKIYNLMPDGLKITGEEDEITAFKTYGKLYEFSSKQKNWVERGSGYFKLNDTKGLDNKLKSRLIMRNQGNLRLILNSFIFNKTNPENPTSKSLRFSGVSLFNEMLLEQEEPQLNSNITTYLFKSNNAGDIEALTSALNSRINDIEQTQSPQHAFSDSDNSSNGSIQVCERLKLPNFTGPVGDQENAIDPNHGRKRKNEEDLVEVLLPSSNQEEKCQEESTETDSVHKKLST